MKAATEYRISSGKPLELNQVVAIFFFPPKLEVLYPEEWFLQIFYSNGPEQPAVADPLECVWVDFQPQPLCCSLELTGIRPKGSLERIGFCP